MDHRLKYRPGFVPTEFGHLAYHYSGDTESDAAYLFLGGMFESALEFSHYLFSDASDNVLRFFLDVRAHGSSSRTESFPTISERAQDIELFLNNILHKFNNVKRIYLIGFSQGATVILQFLLNANQYLLDSVETVYLIAPRVNVEDSVSWFIKDIDEMNSLNRNDFSKKYRSRGYHTFTREYFNEVENIKLSSKAVEIKNRVVIFYGIQDVLVKLSDVETFVQNLRSPNKLNIYKSFGHSINKKQYGWMWKKILKDSQSYRFRQRRRRTSTVNNEELAESFMN